MKERYEVDPHRALPTSAYRHESHQVDLDAIWHDDWVFVATIDEVGSPGDWVAITVGAQPVILLHRQDGELAAMSNLMRSPWHPHRRRLGVGQTIPVPLSRLDL